MACARAGIKRGDRVAILLPQAPEAAAAHVATYKLAAIALPTALLFGPDAIAYRLQNSGAAALITNAQGLAKLADIRTQAPDLKVVLSIDGAGEGAENFQTLLARASPQFEPAQTSPDDPAMMIYTSGTTGQPKGALHGHRVLLGHLPGVEMPHDFFPQPGDRFWTPADWAWAGGLLDALLPSLHHGVAVVARRYEKFDPEEAYALMARHGCAMPSSRRPGFACCVRRKARAAGTICGCARSARAASRSAPRRCNGARKRSASSSTNSTARPNAIWCCHPARGSASRARARSASRCPATTVAVIDAAGRPVAPGILGQIAVKRPDPVMFLEYWGQPEATRDKFVGDWMTTGDQGMMDEEGYFHFVGRDDDVITSSGYRIGPGEIEDCLISHPAVALAAVVGKPDAVRTEIVKAFVVLKTGRQPTDALASELTGFRQDAARRA